MFCTYRIWSLVLSGNLWHGQTKSLIVTSPLLLVQENISPGNRRKAGIGKGGNISDIDQLEALDKTLLRRIFRVPESTPIAALFLESGCVRIGTLIKARRINFLQYMLKLPRTEMMSEFFFAQWNHSSKNDWTEQVRKDLSDFGFPRDLESLEQKSVESFKKLTKKKMMEYELRCLL